MSKRPVADEDRECRVPRVSVHMTTPEDCRVWIDDLEYTIETLK